MHTSQTTASRTAKGHTLVGPALRDLDDQGGMGRKIRSEAGQMNYAMR